MKRAYWRLKYARDVVTKLYELRERGFAAHAAIKALAYQEEPWTGMLVQGGQIAWYEFEVEGCHAIHGDRELAYWGDLETGEPVEGSADVQRAWLWHVAKVSALAADQSHAATFFCGGSRNAGRFIDLFDEVFVLEIDRETLERRLGARPQTEWGGTAEEGESFARRQHATKEGLPANAIMIDGARPKRSEPPSRVTRYKPIRK